MSFIAAALIGAGGALLGGVLSSRATKTASQAATQAADQNNALQREIYGRNTTNLSPFMQSGTQAGSAINALLGLGGNPQAQQQAFQGFRDSTGYQFAQDEAQRGVTGSFAARGLGQSGAALKALSDRSRSIGDASFGNYLAALQGQQGTGLSAANALAGVGTNFAGAVGANNNAAADARGNAALAGAAQTNGLLGSLAQTGGYLYGQGAFGSSYRPPANGGYVPGYNPAWQGG